jgi:hypothetical protein
MKPDEGRRCSRCAHTGDRSCPECKGWLYVRVDTDGDEPPKVLTEEEYRAALARGPHTAAETHELALAFARSRTPEAQRFAASNPSWRTGDPLGNEIRAAAGLPMFDDIVDCDDSGRPEGEVPESEAGSSADNDCDDSRTTFIPFAGAHVTYDIPIRDPSGRIPDGMIGLGGRIGADGMFVPTHVSLNQPKGGTDGDGSVKRERAATVAFIRDLGARWNDDGEKDELLDALANDIEAGRHIPKEQR